MAVVSRSIHINRNQVAAWILGWKRTRTRSGKTLREHLQEKLDVEGHGETMVDTSHHHNLPQSTSLIDLVMMDLESYGVTSDDLG